MTSRPYQSSSAITRSGSGAGGRGGPAFGRLRLLLTVT
ncbi:hypothetical protein K701_15445 [Streptomyces fradiae ATCC 10745 = DSM 40063]|uniref:Uncharacterized protein n=1 Tax=Streptomyces fradiae ATCC 10745 = DSM 40063 TaxID=1319510 RepID=A0ABQ6XT67_STRFR|nr:hypothetical protein K701_15445 [Streptomyces fradiae ATCC 10745 = DSM 40063]